MDECYSNVIVCPLFSVFSILKETYKFMRIYHRIAEVNRSRRNLSGMLGASSANLFISSKLYFNKDCS